MINLTKGVGYYNKDNIDNTNKKENKENEVGMAGPSDLLLPQDVSSSHSQAEPLSIVSLELPTPFTDKIKRCVIQLFDNGEGIAQRYKIKIRFNKVDEGNPEFIANLTLDRRNFVKYHPEESREEIIDWNDVNRRELIKLDIKPFMGKFHHYDPKNKLRNQIQPYTATLVWRDEEGWKMFLKFYDWEIGFDLLEQYITANQRSNGVIAQATWENPAYARPRAPVYKF